MEVSAARTVCDFIRSRLHEWGERRVYCHPGDDIGALMAAWQRRERYLGRSSWGWEMAGLASARARPERSVWLRDLGKNGQPAWLLVEKILAPNERLPAEWQVDGHHWL